MRRIRIDAAVSRPLLLHWLESESRQCHHAVGVWEALIDAARHTITPYRFTGLGITRQTAARGLKVHKAVRLRRPSSS